MSPAAEAMARAASERATQIGRSDLAAAIDSAYDFASFFGASDRFFAASHSIRWDRSSEPWNDRIANEMALAREIDRLGNRCIEIAWVLWHASRE